MLRIALILILAGLGFRITAVPFHFYAPDVFQGVTSAAAAMLSFVPKIVGFAALLRLIPLAGGNLELEKWVAMAPVRELLAALAVLTMFIGNLLAVRQRNLHRLLAYSSVAHAGYMLVGLTIGTGTAGVSGVSALLFYLVIYGLMTVGAFALIAGGGTLEKPIQTDTDLGGLSRTQPALALCLAICLFSLTGLPPTAGFLGKLNLFFAAWSEGAYWGQPLAILLALNAAIGAWYYLRLIAVMYLDSPPATENHPVQPAAWVAGAVCTVAVLFIFVMPQWLWDAALAATR
jgi:NADH-quinone oxidoreductase subunit N